MSDVFSTFIALLLKSGMVLLAANEVRGLVLTAPVFYGMYQAGGTLVAIWLGICSLSGIALSVVVPLFVARKFNLFELASARRAPALASVSK